MFSILKNTNRIITKGYYFPFPINYFNGSTPFHIFGFRKDSIVVTLGQSDNYIYQTDIGVEIHFPVPAFNVRNSDYVMIRLKNPAGMTVDTQGFVIGPNLVGYVSQPGDFLGVGVWTYQLSVRFDANTYYHLNSGKFRVRTSL